MKRIVLLIIVLISTLSISSVFAETKYIYTLSKWNGFKIAQDENNLFILYKDKVVYTTSNTESEMACSEAYMLMKYSLLRTQTEKDLYNYFRKTLMADMSYPSALAKMKARNEKLYNILVKRACWVDAVHIHALWKGWYTIQPPLYEEINYFLFSSIHGEIRWNLGSYNDVRVGKSGVYIYTTDEKSGDQSLLWLKYDGSVVTLYEWNIASSYLKSYELLLNGTIRLNFTANSTSETIVRQRLVNIWR